MGKCLKMDQSLKTLADISKLCDLNAATDLVLIPNKRLASAVRESWSIEKSKTCKTWLALEVKTIDDWLTDLFNLMYLIYEPIRDKKVISAEQDQFLWEEIIKNSKQNYPLQTAQTFSETLDQLNDYDCDLSEIPLYKESTRNFYLSSKKYLSKIKKNKFISRKKSYELILDYFQNYPLAKKYNHIVCYGFEHILPIHKKIVGSSSTKLSNINPGTKNANVMIATCENPQHELYAASRWAADKLVENSNNRIAIIVPDLASSLDMTYRIVNEALTDKSLKIPVNISAGKKLSDTSIGESFINLLKSFLGKHSYESWINLLYDPFTIFRTIPLETQHKIEILIRENSEVSLDLRTFVNFVINEKNWANTDLSLEPIEQIKKICTFDTSYKTSFSNWARFFRTCFEDLVQSQSHSYGELELQQSDMIAKLLDKFETMDAIEVEIGFQVALMSLINHARRTIFHPRTIDSPLQILGILEGINLEFDATWLCSVTADKYPQKVKNHPILPMDFRKKHNMKRSDPIAELDYARVRIESFKKNCSHLVLSYSRASSYGELTPSPILKTLVEGQANLITPYPFIYLKSFINFDETLTFNDQAPSLNSTIENVKITSQTIENQAICPFNAFAIHRLKATPLAEPKIGLDPRQKGILLHETLHILWKKLGDSTTLNTSEGKKLLTLLESSINESLSKSAAYMKCLRGPSFRDLEFKRLKGLIIPWLDLEKDRSAFSVKSLEYKKEVFFNDTPLKLRVDRIDEIDGNFFIIDYKSGISSKNDWQRTPLTSIQLPLYSLALNEEVIGFANAQVRSNQHKFVGLSKDKRFPGDVISEKSWSVLRESWHTEIANLIDAFKIGESSLTVNSTKHFNYHDYLIPLNRFYESLMTSEYSEVGTAHDE